MTRNTTYLLTSLLIIASLPPVEAGGDPAHTVFQMVDDQSAFANCNAETLDVIQDNLINPPLQPETVDCAAIDGNCVFTETSPQGSTIRASAWHLIFYMEAEVTVDDGLETWLDCEGQFQVDVYHFGDFGLRTVESVLGETAVVTDGAETGCTIKQAGCDEDRGNAASTSRASQDGCLYLGPTHFCHTHHRGFFSSNKKFDGKVISTSGNALVCADLSVWNLDMEQGATNQLSQLGVLSDPTFDTTDEFPLCKGLPMPEVAGSAGLREPPAGVALP